MAWFGEVFKDSKGEILKLYHGSNSFETNNTTELEGFFQGLSLVSRSRWLLVMVEGDSRVIIHMSRKLSTGKKAKKVVTIWCLLSRIEILGTLISMDQDWYFGHVRREANKVVDLMEKVGMGGG